LQPMGKNGDVKGDVADPVRAATMQVNETGGKKRKMAAVCLGRLGKRPREGKQKRIEERGKVIKNTAT